MAHPDSGIPEDVVEDLEEAVEELREELKRGYRKRKLRYPSNRDIAEAVRSVSGSVGVPEDLFAAVREYLESRGFYTGLVSERRVWMVYEGLVRKKAIRDFLGVLEGERLGG